MADPSEFKVAGISSLEYAFAACPTCQLGTTSPSLTLTAAHTETSSVINGQLGLNARFTIVAPSATLKSAAVTSPMSSSSQPCTQMSFLSSGWLISCPVDTGTVSGNSIQLANTMLDPEHGSDLQVFVGYSADDGTLVSQKELLLHIGTAVNLGTTTVSSLASDRVSDLLMLSFTAPLDLRGEFSLRAELSSQWPAALSQNSRCSLLVAGEEALHQCTLTFSASAIEATIRQLHNKIPATT